MKKIDIPAKFPIPFAAFADAPYISQIPVESQIGTNPGRASLTDGFVPRNMQPIDAGGIPPFGQDENGIMFQTTSWDRWLSVGGPVYYDADFATGSGGYPAEAIIRSAIVPGKLWMSTIDDNVSDPDAFGAGWVEPSFGYRTGDVIGNLFPSDPRDGWIVARAGLTIGAAGSPATFASAQAVFLYVKTWNKFSNAQCPVTGGRGANALADFNALKPIQVYDMSGAGMIGNDGASGRLAGVPVISGSATVTGSLVGENRHALTVDENGSHFHTGTTGVESTTHTHSGSGTTGGMNAGNPHAHNGRVPGYSDRNYSQGDSSALSPTGATGVSITVDAVSVEHGHFYSFVTGGQSALHVHGFTTQASGSSTPHNTVCRSAVVDWLQKL